MNWNITWLLVSQAVALGASVVLSQTGHDTTAFWLLFAAFFGLGAWTVLNARSGAKLLRWLQLGDLNDPPSGSMKWWQAFGDAAITIQRREMRKTTQAQEKLDAFLDAIQALPIGVVLLDESGRMEWFNLIAAEHFGFKNPQDLQQHIIHLLRDPQFVNYWLRSQNENGITIHGRNHTPRHPVRVSVQFFCFGEGKRLLLSHDVTILEQTDRVRRDFVSNVSHEIRTPLTVLSGFVETLQTIALDATETRRYLDLMAGQAQRMQVLVSDLLTLSRLEGGPPPNTSERVAVIDLLQQCVHDAQSLSRVLGNGQDIAHHITLENRMREGLQLMGSRNELRSALGNLLSNAVRYTPVDGSIVLQAESTADGGLRLAVRDTGFGIAREHLARITERFYRIDKSRSRETGGTGLGLAIVKHIAQRHGATLDISSEVGHGSCFSLVFTAQRLTYSVPLDAAAA